MTTFLIKSCFLLLPSFNLLGLSVPVLELELKQLYRRSPVHPAGLQFDVVLNSNSRHFLLSTPYFRNAHPMPGKTRCSRRRRILIFTVPSPRLANIVMTSSGDLIIAPEYYAAGLFQQRRSGDIARSNSKYLNWIYPRSEYHLT